METPPELEELDPEDADPEDDDPEEEDDEDPDEDPVGVPDDESPPHAVSAAVSAATRSAALDRVDIVVFT